MLSPLIGLAMPLARRLAPALVSGLLGNKAPERAASIMGVIQQITGGSSPEEAAALMESNQEFQQEFASRELELAAELDMAFLEDRQDARARDVAFLEAGVANTRANILAYASVVMLAGLLLALFFFAPEDEWSKTTLGILTGIVTKIVSDVFAFEFGSSRGSKAKAAELARAAETAPDA